jgi:hypothetical protein
MDGTCVRNGYIQMLEIIMGGRNHEWAVLVVSTFEHVTAISLTIISIYRFKHTS